MVAAALAPKRKDGGAPERQYAALGEMIATARHRMRWSGREAAGFAGVKYGTWANIESGIGRPRIEQIPSIARLLDLDAEELEFLARYRLRRMAGDTMPVKPAYRGVLQRLQDRFSLTELTAFEQAMAAVFVERRSASAEPAEDGNGDQHDQDAPNPDPDL